MRHCRSHRHTALVPKSADKPVGRRAQRAVPFDQRDLADVFAFIHQHLSVRHRKLCLKRLGRGLIFNNADDIGCDRVRALWSCNHKVSRLTRLTHIHSATRVIRPVVMRTIHETFAILGNRHTPRDDMLNRQACQIRSQDHIGPTSGGQRPQLAFQTKVGRGVQRRHLQSDNRITPTGYRMAHHTVHVSIVNQSA